MSRILTWNVNHRIREKAIPPKMAAALLSLNPNVVVLTEFVPGPSREDFYHSLADGGLPHILCSTSTRPHNHVLIASKTALKTGDIFAPLISPSMPSNALHVGLTVEGFEVLGMRIPDFSRSPALRRECWDWIIQTTSSVKNRPFMLLGDFNTDPKYSKARCGDQIARLVGGGWQNASPAAGFSYWTLKGLGVRIDHAFFSNHFRILGTEYVEEANGYIFVGKSGMSDHAALVVDFEAV